MSYEFPDVTRFELIQNGLRRVVECGIVVQFVDLQDEGRTLKVFITDKWGQRDDSDHSA